MTVDPWNIHGMSHGSAAISISHRYMISCEILMVSNNDFHTRATTNLSLGYPESSENITHVPKYWNIYIGEGFWFDNQILLKIKFLKKSWTSERLEWMLTHGISMWSPNNLGWDFGDHMDIPWVNSHSDIPQVHDFLRNCHTQSKMILKQKN